jgi:hypothetical protein
MSNHRASLLAGFLLALSSGCEKTAARPPEVAAAPAETAAPAATTPVAAPEASAAPVPAEPMASAAPEPVAPSAASAAPSPSAAPSASAPKGKPVASASKPAPPPAETATAPGATPDDACTTKNFHYSQVASACKSGGRKSAKVIMKNAVAKAKAAGTDLKCTSCHEDMKEFHLKSNAVGDLKNWL